MSVSRKVRRFSLQLHGRPPIAELIDLLRARYRASDDEATRERMVTLIRILQVQRREATK